MIGYEQLFVIIAYEFLKLTFLLKTGHDWQPVQYQKKYSVVSKSWDVKSDVKQSAIYTQLEAMYFHQALFLMSKHNPGFLWIDTELSQFLHH